MYKIIEKIKTIDQYNKKYRNCRNSLTVLTKKEVEEFDLLNNCKGEKRLLKDKHWALIENKYYEIPKPIRFAWFRNLNGGVQILSSVLLAGAVGTSVALPIILLRGGSNTPVTPEEKISLSDWQNAIKEIISDTSTLTMKYTESDKGEYWGGQIDTKNTYNFIFDDDHHKQLNIESEPDTTYFYTYLEDTNLTYKQNTDEGVWFAVSKTEYDEVFKVLKACGLKENYDLFTLNNSIYSAKIELDTKYEYTPAEHNIKIELDENKKIKNVSDTYYAEGSGIEIAHSDKLEISKIGTSKIEKEFPDEPTVTLISCDRDNEFNNYESQSFNLKNGKTYSFYINYNDDNPPLVDFALYSDDSPYNLTNATCTVKKADDTDVPHTIKDGKIIFTGTIQETEAIYVNIKLSSDVPEAYGYVTEQSE